MTFGVTVAALAAGVAWAVTRAPASPPVVTRQAAPLTAGPDTIEIKRLPAGRSMIDYARLDARLQRLIRSRAMVGLAVAVVEDGRLTFLKGYGVTEAGSADPVRVSTVFRWASLSKTVASTLVAKLAAQGRLSLDDPIAKWSSSLKLPGGSERIVTVADVLSHRNGIVKNAYDDKLEEGQDPRDIRRMLGGLDRFCKPGTCFAYQNIAYDAASEVVQKASGESYAAAVKDRLFAPLGMTNASIGRPGLVGAKSWAKPSQGSRKPEVNEAYYRIPAAGGVNSSILDLGQWMRAQLGEVPRVLPPGLLEEIHEPRVKTPRYHPGPVDLAMSEPSYGLGFRSFTYAGHRLVGHRGAVRGYRSLILFDPARKAGIAALWNSESIQPVGLQLELFDMLYGLPRKDWLKLDGAKPAEKPPEKPDARRDD